MSSIYSTTGLYLAGAVQGDGVESAQPGTLEMGHVQAGLLQE